MADPLPIDDARKSTGAGRDHLVWTYPLAFLAAHVSFVPLFALLLPRKIEQLAGEDSLTILSWILLSGALTAGIANIVSGHAGDRWLARFGQRRGLIAIGLVLLAASFSALAAVNSVHGLIVAIIAYQISLNIVFAPLAALMSDYVPDTQAGRFGGWLNTALPIASILTAILAWQFPDHDPAAFWITLAVIIGGLVPLLVLWPTNRPILKSTLDTKERGETQRIARSDFAIVWLSRFFIQFGAAIMLGYLFAYLVQLAGDDGFPATATRAVGILSMVAAGSGVVAAIAAGHLSDFSQRRIWPIAMGGFMTSIALALLIWGENWMIFIAAYGLFHLGIATFLAVDAALVAQLLRGNRNRGTYLGILNLTNTLPGVVGPILTLAALAEMSDMGALRAIFMVACVFALIASLLIFRVRSIR